VKDGWQKNGSYKYSADRLRRIAITYREYCRDRVSLNERQTKDDFDRALNSLGKEKWYGEVNTFEGYKLFTKEQQAVIAQMLGITDEELEFKDIRNLRIKAYKKMTSFLNKGR